MQQRDSPHRSSLKKPPISKLECGQLSQLVMGGEENPHLEKTHGLSVVVDTPE